VVAAHANGDVFAEQLGPGDRQVAARFQLAGGPGVVRQEDARDAKPSGGTNGGTDQPCQGMDDVLQGDRAYAAHDDCPHTLVSFDAARASPVHRLLCSALQACGGVTRRGLLSAR
jgi:hypothetical protein